MGQIEIVFATKGDKLDVKSGAAVAALVFLLRLLIPQTNEQKYFVPTVFAVLLVAQKSDPGGNICGADGRNVSVRSLTNLRTGQLSPR